MRPVVVVNETANWLRELRGAQVVVAAGGLAGLRQDLQQRLRLGLGFWHRSGVRLRSTARAP